MKDKEIYVLIWAHIMQHKCEIHSFSTKLTTKILRCKQSEG